MNYRMLKEDLISHIECSICRISEVQNYKKCLKTVHMDM